MMERWKNSDKWDREGHHCVDLLSSLGVDPPINNTQRNKCLKFLETGVLDVFCNFLKKFDSSFEIHFSDDFGQICLTKKEDESLKKILNVKISKDKKTNDKIINVEYYQGELISISTNQYGIIVFDNLVQAIGYSSNIRYVPCKEETLPEQYCISNKGGLNWE